MYTGINVMEFCVKDVQAVVPYICTVACFIPVYSYCFVVDFNQEEFSKEYYAAFGPDSVYEQKNAPEYEKGKSDAAYPIKGHWRNGVMKDFISKYESKQKTGKPEVDDPDVVVCTIPLMGYFAGKDDFLKRCKAAGEVLQTYKPAVSSALMAAKILEKYILKADETRDPKLLLQKVAAEWIDLSDMVDPEIARSVEEVLQADFTMSAIEATKKFGMA